MQVGGRAGPQPSQFLWTGSVPHRTAPILSHQRVLSCLVQKYECRKNISTILVGVLLCCPAVLLQRRLLATLVNRRENREMVNQETGVQSSASWFLCRPVKCFRSITPSTAGE